MNTEYKNDMFDYEPPEPPANGDCDEKSEGCEGTVHEYLLPDDTTIMLCDKHASGLFCLTCGSFTGGTEDVFIYGPAACSVCADYDDMSDADNYDYTDFEDQGW